MNKRILTLSLLVCMCIGFSTRAYCEQQYLQIMHENKLNKTQPVQKQYSKVSQPVKPVQTKTTPANARNTMSVNQAECDKYYNLGMSQADENNMYGALASFTRALDNNPNSVKVLKARGQVKNNLGDYRGAIQDLNKGISLKADGDMYYLRGFSKLAMQNYPEAVKDFNKAIELTPANDMAYHRRGYSYCLWGKSTNTRQYFSMSLGDFNKAIQLNPKNTEAYLYRGMAKAELEGASKGLSDIEYAMNEFKKQGDTNNYQTSVQIYNWIKQSY